MNQKSSSHFFSLIIPVYRQEKTIVQNIRSIKDSLDKIRYDHEIIAVFDGRVDASYQKVKSANIAKLKTLCYMRNQGKAHAIQLGMKKAAGDYVMFIDSGMEINPNGISILLEHMEWYDADITVGSKRHPESKVNYSPMRRLLSEGYYWIVKILFGIKVRDTQAGIKIFKKNVLAKILPRLVEKKFAGDLEMLVVADTMGFKRIFEAPIRLDYSLGTLTTAATLRSIWDILIDTLAIWYRKNILRYYS
jgi:glycosyltransferase involved in cell wall biosynthesis